VSANRPRDSDFSVDCREVEGPKLAVSRSPPSSSERQLWRKPTLKFDESTVMGDPQKAFGKFNNELSVPFFSDP